MQDGRLIYLCNDRADGGGAQMKVYCLFHGKWDQDLVGVYANEESALKAGEKYTATDRHNKDWWIDEWEVEDLINKEK